MNLVQLWLTNKSSQPISRVKVVSKSESGNVVSFPEIPVLFPGSASSMAQIHVDFGGQLEKIELQIVTGEAAFDVSLMPVAGELLVPLQMNADEFAQRIAMTDSASLHTSDLIVQPPVQLNTIIQATLKDCNVGQIYEINNVTGATGRCKFAGRVRGGSGEVVMVGLEFQISSGKTKLLVVSANVSLAQRISTNIKRNLPIVQG
ncbi:hypothetical protein P43SY_006507 [Pythium insidiosum]|uniref:Uncharacterized protein n=1 Tax=Pythium insidiosum TaxID=114742 RepID=A0AAD5LKR8_PYTIN|nr:hypothetical protein P43SY_006507 [Pythium insidiosum]